LAVSWHLVNRIMTVVGWWATATATGEGLLWWLSRRVE
jgi:hypothetical protein